MNTAEDSTAVRTDHENDDETYDEVYALRAYMLDHEPMEDAIRMATGASARLATLTNVLRRLGADADIGTITRAVVWRRCLWAEIDDDLLRGAATFAAIRAEWGPSFDRWTTGTLAARIVDLVAPLHAGARAALVPRYLTVPETVRADIEAAARDMAAERAAALRPHPGRGPAARFASVSRAADFPPPVA